MASETDAPVHAFASYNKAPLPRPVTLVGNWQEEQALKSTTGTARYEPWVAQGEPTSIYASRQDHASEMPTFPRVIEHLEQTPPQNWQTMQQISYQNPGTAKRLQEYSKAPLIGRREQLELEMLKAEAADLPPEVEATLTGHPIPHLLETTQRADFIEKDLTANKVGSKVMQDRDGRPAVRDPTFLAETQLMPRHLADRVLGEAAVAAGATQTITLPNPDVPITLYSEAVAARKYTGSIYGTMPAVGGNPFGKYTNFSKPMSEYNKIVVDE